VTVTRFCFAHVRAGRLKEEKYGSARYEVTMYHGYVINWAKIRQERTSVWARSSKYLLRNSLLQANLFGYSVGWDSVVGIATRYGLDGP